MNRTKPTREKLIEANNANMVNLAEKGFRAIDNLAARGTAGLKARGIVGTEEILQDLANVAKKLLMKGLSK